MSHRSLPNPMQALRRLWLDESGASASEYAVLTALVVVAVAGALSVFDLNVFFGIGTKVLSCVNGAC